MTSTLTAKDRKAIATFLEGKHIPAGLGTAGEACSIASINLALYGRLSDTIPECMSPVIGRWIIRVQDRMPDSIRNSDEWRRLLPLAAGTGRTKETERRAIILDWMWGTVLPTIQPLADKRGFGAEWLAMTTDRTYVAARTARIAARKFYFSAEAEVEAVAAVAVVAEAVAVAAVAEAVAAVAEAEAVAAAAGAVAAVAEAAGAVAAAAAVAAVAEVAEAVAVAHTSTFESTWLSFDPAGLLKRLVKVA